MAVVITPFDHQNIEIQRPYSMDIPISGNPSDVSVSSRIVGFTYHWTGSVIEWRGTPNVLGDNISLTIRADDVVYRQTFTVHPAMPVIGNLSRVTVQRGRYITVPIPITGHVSELKVRGPWIGLRWRLKDNFDGELYGTIPSASNADLTTRVFEFSIEAYNRTVFDTATLELELAI